MPRPLDPDKRAAILADIRTAANTGKPSCRAIAKAHGVSPGTVSKIRDEAGLDDAFERSQTVQATRAREVDTAAIRAELAARRAAMAVTLQAVAEREVRKMSEPAKYWDWGGKEHDYDECVQPEPHAQDRRAMMATASQALDKSLKLVPPTEDAGERSRSLIGDLMAGLAADYAERHGGPPPEPDYGDG